MPVDWSQVAASAIAVLVPLTPYLQKGGEEVAKQIGKEAWDKGKAIYHAILERFDRDKDQKGRATLDFFLENPDLYDKALVGLIEQKLKDDPEFGKNLQGLVQQAAYTEGMISFMNNFYSKVGKFVQIGTAGTVEIK